MIAVEYSFSAKCFHVEPLGLVISGNVAAFLRGGASDFVLMGLFETEKQANKFITSIEEANKQIDQLRR